MSDQNPTQTAPAPKPATPKVQQYLVFWWANKGSASFANGTSVITLTGGNGMTEAMLPEVRDFIRKESGERNANVMAFSKLEG